LAVGCLSVVKFTFVNSNVGLRFMVRE